jgi:hypothetical protein
MIKENLIKGVKEKRVFMKPGSTNKEDRINFVEFWADYVRTHSDEEWSRQQNILINSVMQNIKVSV